MPGIVGIVTNRPQAEAENELKQMLETLRHESFYVAGTWSDPSRTNKAESAISKPIPAMPPTRGNNHDSLLLCSTR